MPTTKHTPKSPRRRPPATVWRRLMRIFRNPFTLSVSTPGHRRTAGGWLYGKMFTRQIAFLVAACLFTGLLIGYLTSEWLLTLPFSLLISLFGIGVFGYGIWLIGWRLDEWEMGSDGEERTGQAIEQALAAKHCAVAHNVTEIRGTIGDIDHLVATPGVLWVVETKYHRVPKNYFPEVLRRIRQNVRAIRNWADKEFPEANTQVQGCLVLVEPHTPSRPYTKKTDENILIFDGKSFREMLQKAAQHDAPTESQLSDMVWRLGLRQ